MAMKALQAKDANVEIARLAQEAAQLGQPQEDWQSQSPHIRYNLHKGLGQ